MDHNCVAAANAVGKIGPTILCNKTRCIGIESIPAVAAAALDALAASAIKEVPIWGSLSLSLPLSPLGSAITSRSADNR